MLQRLVRMSVALGYSLALMAFLDAQANTPVWDNWHPLNGNIPYDQTFQQTRQDFLPTRQGQIPTQLQHTAYLAPQFTNDSMDCGLSQALNLPNLCLRRTIRTKVGLEVLIDFLQQKKPWQQVAPLGVNLPNQLLMETAKQLFAWHEGMSSLNLADQFALVPINSAKGMGKGNFTGYFTPILNASHTPSARFNIPIYAKPPSRLSQLSHAEIVSGALSGRGLEIAWVDDPFSLNVAQVQGAAVVQFPDGHQSVLAYAGNNNQPFTPISRYLLNQGYMSGSLSNESISQWLRQHPDKMREVLTSNARYVFFKETDNPPETALGHSVIPGHTVAVDSRYIPHGSVLLAELPRVNMDGSTDGTEWRLLFAQDNGKAIQGNGRIDLYTGSGHDAEKAAYAISGARRVFMLLRKPDASQMAGLY